MNVAVPKPVQPADRLVLEVSEAREGAACPATLSCSGWSISGYCLSEE